MPLSFTIFSPFSELAIGMFGQDDDCTSDEECAQTLGFSHVAKLHQVHGNIIHTAIAPIGFEIKGDGLITMQRNLALSVRWADCQGFIIYAPEKHVLGVLHAGWRGMAEQAITAMYEHLNQEYSIDPEETVVGITPSICKECCSFSDPLNELPEHLHPFVDPKINKVDLQAAADAELYGLGVPTDQIERHPACTMCGEGFWSWRRDKVETARNYLVAGIKNS